MKIIQIILIYDYTQISRTIYKKDFIDIILIFIIKSVCGTCDKGFYDSAGFCNMCNSSCDSCTNGTSCLSCASTMFLNTTSGLCQNCPISQYYDSTSEVCRDCNGKCTVSCSYQKACFQCTGTQYYDLEMLQCVDSCNSSKISVNNTQFQGIPICKSLDIYVDPTSTSVTELGTKSSPYKSLLLAFIEILNLHSHSNRTINVYVQTGTTLFVMPDSMYVINVNKVNLLTYTGSSTSNLRPKVYSVSSGATILSPKTLFNIISNIALNLSVKISNSLLTTKEQSDLQTTYVGFMINRCDFTINGFDFVTNHTQNSKIFTWIKAVYEQSKSISINNMNIAISGNIFDSFDPLTLILNNLNIDYYKCNRGFYILVQCNYANASLLNEISINSLTVLNSEERSVSQTNSFLYVSGNANFTINNSSVNLYGSDIENFPQIYFSSSSNCNPNDGVNQYLTIQNTAFVLIQSNNTRFSQIYSNIDANYSREITISLINLNFNEIMMNTQPIINLYASMFTSVIANNVIFVNSTFIKDIVFISNVGSMQINNCSFKNISQFGESMLSISGGLNVDINGLNIDSCTLSSEENEYYYQHVSTSGYTNITGLFFTNTDLKNRAAVYLSSVPSLTIKSSSITGSVIYPSNSIIQTGSLSELNIDGFNFTQITSLVSGDNTNYLFSFDSFDLSKSTNFVMNKVIVSQSVLAVLSFSKVVNPSSLSKTFTISNFQYTNSSFSDKNNLITFTKLEQSINFSIIMINITFNSVSFNVSGNLVSFQQQLSNFVTIYGFSVSSTTNANIYLEAVNKQNILLPVGVKISNLVTSNVNSGSNSFIEVYENSIINITSSTIQTITSVEGAVLSVNTATSQANIDNSTIQSNSATEGGAFHCDNSGVLKVYSSKIINNVASSSGVIKVLNGGRFEFYGCTITSNSAADAPIAVIFDSPIQSIINNCMISSNTVISGSSTTSYSIQLISSILITNSTNISNQDYILSSFVSTVTLENSIIQSASYSNTIIRIIGSTFNFNNMILRNISQYMPPPPSGPPPSGGGPPPGFENFNPFAPIYLIQSSMSSIVYISNCTYTNSSLALFLLQQSSCTITNFNVYDMTSFGMIRIEGGVNTTLSNWNITASIYNDTIYMFNSYTYLIKDILIDSTGGVGIHSVQSKIDTITGLIFKNISSNALSFENSNIALLSNSVFNKIGLTNSSNNFPPPPPGMPDIFNVAVLKGTIYNINSNSTITNCTFSNNNCTSGGALYYSCTGSNFCVNSVENSNMTGNKAAVSGGAIYYDVFRPSMMNIYFQSNTAPYGNDIASYPIRIIAQGASDFQISLSDLVSGQLIPKNLVLKLVDFDNQTTTNSIKGSIIISPANQNTKVLGRNSESIVNGVSSFNGLIFQAKPGSINVPFNVNTNSIDKSTILRQFGTSSIQNSVLASFRFCMPGEIESENQCNICTEGTYSFSWNSTQCYQCPNNANCLGGANIWVDSGYFRKSTNSSYILPCIYQSACLGEYHPENEYPIKCSDGYEGMLCATCVINATDKYERNSSYECSKCPNPLYNILRIIGLILLVSLFFIIMIIVGIKKKRESQQSILLRIIANYLQLLTAAMSFNLKFPTSFSQMMFPAEKIGTSSEAFLSFDCFVRDSNVVTLTPNIPIFKVLLTGLLPIFLILIGLAFWSIAYLFPTNLFKDFKRNMCITVIVILYLLHPMLTKVGLEMFQCIKIDEGKYNSKINLDFGCFSSDHLKWCAFIGVPIIIFLSIGCPVVAFWALFKYRHSLNESNVQRYMLMLYQGLKDRVFYWELVNTTRKILMIAINALLSTLPLIYSAISAVIVLIALLRIQIRLKPYKQELNNKLEIEAMITGTSTLFCGVLFVSDTQNFSAISTLILIVIIIMNIKFFLLWLLCMTYTLIDKHEIFHSIFRILAIATCNKKFANQIKEELGSPEVDHKQNSIETIPSHLKRDLKEKGSKQSKPKPKMHRKKIFKSKNLKHKHSKKKKQIEKLFEEEKVSESSNRIESILNRIPKVVELGSTSRNRETNDILQSFKTNKTQRKLAKLPVIEEKSPKDIKEERMKRPKSPNKQLHMDLSDLYESSEDHRTNNLSMFKFLIKEKMIHFILCIVFCVIILIAMV